VRGYLAPGWFVRSVLNPLAMRTSAASTLVVPTRRTGRTQEVPVNVLDHEGERYLVSVRGESEWVRNVRAAGQVEVRRRGRTERYGVEEVPVEGRPDIVAAYRHRWDRQVRPLFERLPDPADHPVFRLLPAVGPGEGRPEG
jgi:deazaflavin-dependent oxidoreductase (nitroreductase family)